MKRVSVNAGAILSLLLALVAPIAMPSASVTAEPLRITAQGTGTVFTDWTKFHFDNASTGFNPYETILGPSNVNGLVPAWITNVGKVTSSPAVVGGLVYIGSNGPGLAEADLTALHADTGLVAWKRKTRGDTAGSPTLWNGLVYLGTLDDHTLRAFDAATGSPRWSFTGVGAMGAPVVDHQRLFVPSNTGILYALNPLTGAKKWEATTGGILAQSVAVAQAKIFTASDDHYLYAFDERTGRRVWRKPIHDQTGGVPAVSRGVMYVGSGALDAHLYAFDAATGALSWSTPAGAAVNSSPAVAYGLVYVAAGDGVIRAFDASTAIQQWSVPTGNSFGPESPVVANGVVYMGAEDHKVYAIDAISGNVLWTYTTGDQLADTAAVANGVVYTGSFDQNLYAFHLAG